MRPDAPRARRGTPAAALLAAALTVAAPAHAQTPARDSAALVTVLGRDTVAVERWVRTGDRIEAEAAVRSPRTSLRRYTLELGPDGAMRRFEERWLDPDAPAAAPRRVERYEAAQGGWVRRVAVGDSVQETRVDAPAAALPWVDLVHWPFELALARVPAAGSATQPLLAGGRVLAYGVARPAADRATLTHPLRGPSVVRTDAAGRLLALDAAATTRKVVVTRVPWAEVAGAARRWAADERAGRGMGELSGRAQEEFTLGAAEVALDYGVPLRRGREIFGTVVPWGELWRTGANRATHFTTTRELVLGDPAAGGLVVPAGEYTLFSIPAPDGGVLVVNRQTGQNGTAYDAARDLGRVALRRRELAEPVERFTIEVVPTGDATGTLRLAWDRSEFVVPVAVR